MGNVTQRPRLRRLLLFEIGMHEITSVDKDLFVLLSGIVNTEAVSSEDRAMK